ncbi:MAG: hypothetical protein JXB18_11650 [Sedimentisphaerales bacterium]|nr:hypothetical protein [Sedimentisphaerales bacterium]
MDNDNQTQPNNTVPNSTAGSAADSGQSGSLDSQIQQLMASPHYLDGKTNPAEHRRLVEQVQQLYQRQSGDRIMDNETNLPGPQRISDASDSSGAFDVIQQGFVDEAKAEMDRLVELGFDRDSIPNDVLPYQVEALKAQRLLNENNYSEASVVLNRAIDTLADSGMADALTVASTKNLMNQFFASDFLDADFKKQTGEQILTKIFQQQYDYHGAILSALKSNAAPREKIQQIETVMTPGLRRSNFGLYQKLQSERSRLYQLLNPGNLK